MQRPEELSIWLEYFDGKKVYRMRTQLDVGILFEDEIRARKVAAYTSENMIHKLTKELFDRA